MKYHLIIVHPFGKYTKGQMVTDQDEVAAIMKSHNHPSVNKIAAKEDDPADAPDAL